MTKQEKKEFIEKELNSPENRRSYNEIAADLELAIWRKKMKPEENEKEEKDGEA